jgi:hypothetical protein
MHKTMVYLSDRQRAELARRARRRGQPVAAIIREAVDRWLSESDGQPRPRLIGVAAGPRGAPVSERVEELLAAHLRRRGPR